MNTTTFVRAMAMVAGAALCAGAWTACGAAEGTARADGEPTSVVVKCAKKGELVQAAFPGRSLEEMRRVSVTAILAKPDSVWAETTYGPVSLAEGKAAVTCLETGGSVAFTMP